MAVWKYVEECRNRDLTEAEQAEQATWFAIVSGRFLLGAKQKNVLWKLRFEVLSLASSLARDAGHDKALDSIKALVYSAVEGNDSSSSTWKTIQIELRTRSVETGRPDLLGGPLSCAVSCALWIADEHLGVLAEPYRLRDHLFGVHQAAAFIAPWLQRRAIDAWRTALRPMFERVVSEYE